MRALHAAVLAALLLAGAARAGDTSPDPQQDLYLNAMRLMSEGRHDEARAALEKLIAVEPQHAGAWLDLAISQCALGHAGEAERLFREIEVRFAPSAAILEVINEHRRQGCKPWQAHSYRAFTLAYGTDSNVNQGASNPVFVTGSGADRIETLLAEDFLPKRDNYAQATFDYTRELDPRGSVAMVQFRARQHDTLRDQDTNALLLGLDRPFKVFGAGARAMATASAVSLGGSLYQRQVQLQGRIAPPVPLPDKVDLIVSASLVNVSYLTRKSFDSRTGDLGALLNYRGEHTQSQLSGGLVVDHGRNNRLGGNRHGWYASVQLQRNFNDQWQGELGWTRQDWNGQTVYSAGLIDEVRNQSTRQWRGALAYQMGGGHRLQLEWRDVQNKENISLFQYNSQVVQLSWRWAGF
jgi:tetratricopeptide (TPR) repeat protein